MSSHLKDAVSVGHLEHQVSGDGLPEGDEGHGVFGEEAADVLVEADVMRGVLCGEGVRV